MEERVNETTNFSENSTCAKHIRQYQAMRDKNLSSGATAVIDYYMELVCQFGFIALFSSVFPLAPLLSYICNRLQL